MKLKQHIKPVTEEAGDYGILHLNSKFCKGINKLKLGEEFEVDIKVKVSELHTPTKWEVSKLGLKPTDTIAHLEIVGVEDIGEEIMEMKIEKMKKDGGMMKKKKQQMHKSKKSKY